MRYGVITGRPPWRTPYPKCGIVDVLCEGRIFRDCPSTPTSRQNPFHKSVPVARSTGAVTPLPLPLWPTGYIWWRGLFLSGGRRLRLARTSPREPYTTSAPHTSPNTTLPHCVRAWSFNVHVGWCAQLTTRHGATARTRNRETSATRATAMPNYSSGWTTAAWHGL